MNTARFMAVEGTGPTRPQPEQKLTPKGSEGLGFRVVYLFGKSLKPKPKSQAQTLMDPVRETLIDAFKATSIV